MTRFNYLLIAILAVACSAPEPGSVEEKKQQLSELKSQVDDLKGQISDLEDEIAELDTTFTTGARAILVSTLEMKTSEFEHKIEVRGAVESRRNILVSAEIPGKITSIKVKEGQRVRQGQVLLTLDADIIRNNIAELKTALELAEAVFERQANLWKKNIGTEIQYLEAKNRKESLERSLATANSQLDQSIIRAPFSGSIDALPAKEGEIAQPGMPLVRVVNPEDMYIMADVSERFVGRFKQGDEVEVMFPSQNEQLLSKISSISQVINTDNRTFKVEIGLPSVNFAIRPNQVTVNKLRDYSNAEAMVIPTRLIQRDDKGYFVYKVANGDEGTIAQKVHITPGVSYNNKTEIVEGLALGEQIVDKGYRELADGVSIEISTRGASNEVAAN